MEIELLEKKDQPLLSRLDVTFRITHPNERTPRRSDVREELASQLSVNKGNVIIDNMKAVFGKSETMGFAKIYQSEKEAKEIEREHILVRNKLISGKSEKGAEKKDKAPKKEEKAEEKTEEKTAEKAEEKTDEKTEEKPEEKTED
ncbi:MAG: 30S ribosomal protein S24e [Thermoplasmata archaeon]|nr:30S ribosomal protein S24e [Thermoplasmata archaeon]